MASIRQPTKESVRAWLQRRRAADGPPGSPEQICHELGWLLLPTALQSETQNYNRTKNRYHTRRHHDGYDQ